MIKNIKTLLIPLTITLITNNCSKSNKDSWYKDSYSVATLVVDCEIKTEKHYDNIDEKTMEKLMDSAVLWITREQKLDDYNIDYGVFYKKCIQDNIYKHTPDSYLKQRQ